MAQRGGSIFISTNPQNNVPIGVPGQGVFIGRPGPTIYGTGSGGSNLAAGVSNLFGVVDHIAMTPTTVLVAEKF
jgi:hypothetical protein